MLLQKAALTALCLVALLAVPASAAYRVQEDSDIVGKASFHTAEYEDTLLDLALNNDLGYNEITAANAGLDPWIPGEGVQVVMPTEWILPNTARKGIVLNLAEMRLFRYFKKNGALMVETYPVGVGREGDDTPTGVYEITEKEENPSWLPPASIREEKPELPEVVPSGPDNPLGAYKMRLGYTSYLIHGTNKPLGIGRRVSHGCIRLYPDDIKALFESVQLGDKVNVVYQPVKLGVRGDRVMVEVHEDYRGGDDLFISAVQAVIRSGFLGRVDVYKLNLAVLGKTGMPVDITFTNKDAKPRRWR